MHKVTFIVGGIALYHSTRPISLIEIGRQCKKLAEESAKMVMAVDQNGITAEGRSMPLYQAGGQWRLK